MSELKQTKIDTLFRMTKSDKRIMHRKLMLKRTKNNTITDTIDLTKEDYIKLSPSKKSKLNQESSKSAVNGSVSNSKKVSSENVDNNLNAILIKTEVNENLNGNIEFSPSLKPKHNQDHDSTSPDIESDQVNGNVKLSGKSNNLYTIQFNTETNGNNELSSSEKSKLNQDFDETKIKLPEVNKNVRSKKLKEDNLKTTQNGNQKLLRSKKSKLKKQVNSVVKNEIKTEQVYMKYDITEILSSESDNDNDFSPSLKSKTSLNVELPKSKRSTRLENRKQKNLGSSKKSSKKGENSAQIEEYSKSTNSASSEGRKQLNTPLSEKSLKQKSFFAPLGKEPSKPNSFFNSRENSSFIEKRKRENPALYGECSKATTPSDLEKSNVKTSKLENISSNIKSNVETSKVENISSSIESPSSEKTSVEISKVENIPLNIELEKLCVKTSKVENISSSKLGTLEVKKFNEAEKQERFLLNPECSNSRSSIRKEENISTSENSTSTLSTECNTNYKPFISVRRDIFKNISTRNETVINDNENTLNNINFENFTLIPESSTNSISVESRKRLENTSEKSLSVTNRKDSESENYLNFENNKQGNVPSTSESPKSTNSTSIEERNGVVTSVRKEVNTTPRKGVYTSPRKGIYTSPRKGVYTSPRRGVNTSPRKGLNTSPRKGLNTSPSKSENGDDENVNYDSFMRHFHYMLSYIFNHKELKLLLNENQKKTLENLKTFSLKERKICIRLYYRKFMWYRMENLRNDTKLSIDLDPTEMSTLIQKLSSNNFLDTNTSNVNLENLLELLSAPELKDIMKLYKIKSESKKREGVIQRIIKNTKNQKLMFGNPEEKLKKDICKVLGVCVKLTDSFIGCMHRVHLLFGITENKTPQEMHRFLFEFLRKPIENRITFQIDCPKLFENEEEFSDYEENRLQYEQLLSAIENKDNNTAMIIILRAFLKYESCIRNDIFSRKIKEKPSFLRKFSSSNCIVRILSEGIPILKQEIKKPSSSSEGNNKMADELLLEALLQQNFHTSELKNMHALQILDALLAQDLFRTHKKTEWLKEKLMILKNLDINKAVHEFMDIAKIDEHKNNKLTQIYFNDEIQSFLKSKKVSDEHKDELQKLKLQLPCDRFPSITVWAVEVPNNISGRKKMYKSKDDNGQSYSSVEEVAINYYKKYLDYEDGIHCEGSLLSTLFELLFWDIIYEYYVPNTFISPIQSRPLDMFSRWFYTNRKDVIDVRLSEIENWDEKEFEMQLQRMLDKILNYMTPSTLADVQLLMTFVKSINREVLVKMLRKLIEEHGTYRAGFPDIILWNTRTKKCKFAEVKGQHDKLRPKQILWLRFLLSIGADAELCHVHTTGYSKIAQ